MVLRNKEADIGKHVPLDTDGNDVRKRIRKKRFQALVPPETSLCGPIYRITLMYPVPYQGFGQMHYRKFIGQAHPKHGILHDDDILTETIFQGYGPMYAGPAGRHRIAEQPSGTPQFTPAG